MKKDMKLYHERFLNDNEIQTIATLSAEELQILQRMIGLQLKESLPPQDLRTFLSLKTPEAESEWIKAHCPYYQKIVLDCLHMLMWRNYQSDSEP